MSAGVWAAIAAAIPVVLLVLKYFLSGDAAKAKAEAEFQAAEKIHQDQVKAAQEANQASAASDSEGINAAEDAADAYARKVLAQENPK